MHHAVDTDVLINVRPVDAYTVADQFPMFAPSDDADSVDRRGTGAGWRVNYQSEAPSRAQVVHSASKQDIASAFYFAISLAAACSISMNRRAAGDR